MKLHERLFQLLVFLIPTQLSYHLWPDWSFIFGIRIDYLSPTIYLSQLVLLAMIVLFLYSRNVHLFTFSRLKKLCLYVVLFLCVFFLSSGPLVTLSRFPIILSALCLFYYVSSTVKRSRELVQLPFLFSLVFLLVISMLQFLLGHSIDGFMYWFGERPLSVTMPGIALVSIAGVDHLRAYATLPHPNALAGISLVGVTGLFPLFNRKKKLISLVLCTVIIILTFSQTVWIIAVFIPLLFLTVKKISPGLLWLTVPLMFLLSVCIGLLPHFATLSLPKELMERVLLSNTALRTWVNHVLVGVGIGNGILFSPRTLIQPVHNIFLLIAEETGIIGLIVFSLGCIRILHSKNSHAKVVLLIVLLIGLSDHYFLTLLPPLLLCALVAGLTVTSHSPEEST